MEAGFSRLGNPSNGQRIYPQCSSNLAINDDLENALSNFGSANKHLAALTTSGNANDWHVAGIGVNDPSSVTYKIINDGINNKTYFQFKSGNVSYNCEFEDSFDSNADIYFYIQNDCRDYERSWFRTFDIQTRYNMFILI